MDTAIINGLKIVLTWFDRLIISGRKPAEDELRDRGAAMGRLNSALIALSKNQRIYKDDLSTAFRAITETSARALDVCRVSLWFYTDGGDGIKCGDLFERNSGEHSQGVVLEAAAYPAYFRALQAEDCIAADDAVADPRTGEFSEAYLKPLGITSMLDVPIIVAGRVLGVVCHEHVGAARKWTAEERGFVAAIAGFASLAIESHERIKADGEIRKLNQRLELKMEERTKQLLEAREELVRKEKLAILGQLAGSVGHELRNPLGVINNALHFLKTVLPGSDETVHEYLDIIKSEVDNSERIISDLLDFSRTKPPRRQSITVKELISNCLEQRTPSEGVLINTDISETLPPVEVDPFHMAQVLRNLITNACQAMPGGGELSISARRRGASEARKGPASETAAAPGSRAGQDFIEISVADTGEGISPENLRKLFQPLFTTKAKGIGLGLVVSKKLTEANGGRIGVESRPGTGTKFTVSLPATEALQVDRGAYDMGAQLP